MLAGVTDCGRSWKWGYRGRLAQGFKPRRGSRAGAFWDHMTLAKVAIVQLLGSRRDFAWKKRGERILPGEPREGATWFWINWRSQW